MKHKTTKTLSAACVLSVIFFLFCAFILLPQPVRAQTATGTVTGLSEPHGVAVTPDGAYAYVTNWGSGSVSVISPSSNTVTATITVGSDPYGVAVTPDGAYAYVTNANGNTVSVISPSSNTVTATITVGTYPYGVAVTPDGAYAYVTNWGDNTVDVGSTAAGNFVYPEYLYGGLLALTACFGAFALFSKRKNLPSFNSKKTDYN